MKEEIKFDTPHTQLLAALLADYYISIRVEPKDCTQRIRRSMIKDVFSSIEGSSFAMKSWAISVNPTCFSESEKSILEEYTYHLSDTGIAKERKAKLGTLPNVIFSFKALAKAEGVDFTLDTKCQEWKDLHSSLEVRHRLTHPKSLESLIVSPEEMMNLMSGSGFYFLLISNLLTSIKLKRFPD
jgi:hypothetical protein